MQFYLKSLEDYDNEDFDCITKATSICRQKNIIN